jgi:four helix bundle protein
MLRIYDFMLETIRLLRSQMIRIETRDRSLGQQLRRASSSMVLNTAEGFRGRGANRQARYHIALGEAEETLSCFHVAAAHGYIEELDEGLVDRMRRIIGTLVNLSNGR